MIGFTFHKSCLCWNAFILRSIGKCCHSPCVELHGVMNLKGFDRKTVHYKCITNCQQWRLGNDPSLLMGSGPLLPCGWLMPQQAPSMPWVEYDCPHLQEIVKSHFWYPSMPQPFLPSVFSPISCYLSQDRPLETHFSSLVPRSLP